MNLKNKTILVTGGTGSFGNYIVNRLIPYEPKEIRIFSRDEKKQFDMKNFYKAHDFITYHIGDIRDFNRLNSIMQGVDIAYQAAALKHVTACEEAPFEAVQTNIVGIENLIRSAIENNIEKVIGVSTDKAVKPVNVMGMSKAIQERLLINANRLYKHSATKFCVVRYGNVLLSRGSIIPLFRDVLRKNQKIKITDEEMTRFLLTLDDAIDLVFYATEKTQGGEVFVKKAPSTKITSIAEIISEEIGVPFEYDVIGKFPGEKLHEILITEEELDRTQDNDDFFTINPYWGDGGLQDQKIEYSSNEEIVQDKEIIKSLMAKADRRSLEVETDSGTYSKL